MKRSYLFHLSLFIVVVLLAGVPGMSQAASGLSVSMDSAEAYIVTGTADTDDSGGLDYVCVICYNADGSYNDVDIHSFSMGAIDFRGGCNSRFPTSLTPFSVAVFDVDGPYSGQLDNPEGAAYCESFAPKPPAPAPDSNSAEPIPGPDMVFLPEWAVVGTFTQPTPLSYFPDPIALSDTAIGAGQTLWVLGLDETGEFYQVVLSGVYLWVPVETIGPTYGEPWYGRPLPTEIVN